MWKGEGVKIADFFISTIDKMFEIFGPIFKQNADINFKPIFEKSVNFGPIFEKM